MKLAASYLLSYPNWHRPEPGLYPRCEEEIETTEHAILRCPARQYARGSFPETLDLKSARHDATTIKMLSKFVRRTLTAYPPGFTSPQGQRRPHPTIFSLLVCLLGFGVSSIYCFDCTVCHNVFPRVFLLGFLCCSFLLFFSAVLFRFYLS